VERFRFCLCQSECCKARLVHLQGTTSAPSCPCLWSRMNETGPPILACMSGQNDWPKRCYSVAENGLDNPQLTLSIISCDYRNVARVMLLCSLFIRYFSSIKSFCLIRSTQVMNTRRSSAVADRPRDASC